MKASTACKYAVAITFGITVGKALGEFTKGFSYGVLEALLETKKSK